MLKELLSEAITIAQSGEVKTAVVLNGGVFESFKHLGLLAKFVYGSSGTSVKAYIQTSFDGGTTWCDIACFTFTTATANKVMSINHAASVLASYTPLDGAISDDTAKDGLLGDSLRVKLTTTGTYAGTTTLKVYATLN
jgi:hypothetical protein